MCAYLHELPPRVVHSPDLLRAHEVVQVARQLQDLLVLPALGLASKLLNNHTCGT
jgi:hypothetical protein